MSLWKIRSSVALAVLLLATLVACAPPAAPVPTPTEAPPAAAPEPTPIPPAEGPVYGGTLIVGTAGEVHSFDPPVMWDHYSEPAVMMVYSGLYRYRHGTSEIEPEIAADMPEVSEDGLTWTVRMRKDVKFSNGDPLTARDVKYTWDRLLDDQTGPWGAAYLGGVKGAKEALAGEAEGVEGVKVLDDYTVQFELVEPVPFFDDLLAWPWTGIMNQKHVEAVGEDIATKPLGAGPYVLKEFEPGVRKVFEKNPYYFREDEPYADQVVFEVLPDPSVAALKLERGDLHIYSEPIPALEYRRLKEDAAAKVQTFEVEWPDTYLASLNSIQEGFKDLRVRQAIAHCIDRERIVKSVFSGFGTPARTLLPPSDTASYNADQPYYEFNPGKAKELLAEAGYADGFTFETQVVNAWPRNQIGEVVQAQLEQCGIDMSFTQVELAAFHEWSASQHNGIVFQHWPYEIPDPSYVMDGMFSSGALYPGSCCNWSWYSTPELDERLRTARTEVDPVKRGQMYQSLDELVTYDLALVVPLLHPVTYYVVAANVGGFKPPMAIHPKLVNPQFYWLKSAQ